MDRAERTVQAPPERVWELVSDITRAGEWSPEATGGRWRGDATGPAVGATRSAMPMAFCRVPMIMPLSRFAMSSPGVARQPRCAG